MELTNSLRKTFASLSTTKGRAETGLFMAQGTKCIVDTIDAFDCKVILCTADWAEKHPELAKYVTKVKLSELKSISTLSTPPQCIAIYNIPIQEPNEMPQKDELSLALDYIQDPGNLGTIIRVADWMGVKRIFASHTTVDVWSPKVVQATMGAISRVKVIYTDLESCLSTVKGIPVYGTFLDGENIYKSSLSKNGIIVMGNEGNGISPQIESLVQHRLHIPSYPPGTPTSESLNVAIATAITLSEFRRNG